jgi:hypothetical protein
MKFTTTKKLQPILGAYEDLDRNPYEESFNENYSLITIRILIDCWPQCGGSRIFIRDPGSVSASKDSSIFNLMFIPDPDFFFPPASRIQGSKMHRIPDPDPQH